ncbi:uncharacterized protein LAJ45_05146 [Morchella importuna]|uniref:uncharacterized protein n=1 Tax=Morchella importuna TaxID=1174673 RepID=UPI001E8DC663|nr:uncharacterized protein LAJ45_05146 [Morchella importuna]KAH8150963.1 hypothetical protein LAJ45_05146 [Morchella importuna]
MIHALGETTATTSVLYSTTEVLKSSLVVKGINTPRHITFDDRGNLLVAGDRSGIIALELAEGQDGCVEVMRRVVVAENGGLDLYHGVAVSGDGRTIFASSTTTVHAFPYNSTTLSTLPPPPSSQTSPTQATSPAPSILPIHTQTRSFTLTTGQDFTTSGTLLGWGLRNSVGVAQDNVGGVWSVENAPDSIVLEGMDVNERNPAEELNYHGLLPTALETPNYVGPSYGYPTCLTVWDPTVLPAPYSALAVGDPLPLPPITSCSNTTAATLAFDAHTAPLDIKFHPTLPGAFVTFHGSSARKEPAGYKVSWLPFMDDTPTGEVLDVVWTRNRTGCPGACLRPVGLAVDKRGRVWFSADRSGEVWLITVLGVNGTNGTESGGVGELGRMRLRRLGRVGVGKLGDRDRGRGRDRSRSRRRRGGRAGVR